MKFDNMVSSIEVAFVRHSPVKTKYYTRVIPSMNMSHVFSTFSFGSTITPIIMKRLGPYLVERHNRLNGRAYMTSPEDRANVTIEHYLQVVKTEVLGLLHQLIENYEYTTHTSMRHIWLHANTIPAAKFHM